MDQGLKNQYPLTSDYFSVFCTGAMPGDFLLDLMIFRLI